MEELRRMRNDDSGMALMIVIGAIALMVVLATAGFYVSSQTLFETTLADQHDAAFQAASSGVMVAFADLRSKLPATLASSSYTGSIATSAAAYAVEVARNPTQSGYDCTSTGTATDGTKEIVVASFAMSPVTASTLPWGNDVFYFAGSPGATIVGNGQITGPFYVKFPPSGGLATLDFGSSAAGFVGGPVYVENGNLTIKGTPPAPIDIYLGGTLTLAGNAMNHPEMFINHGWDPTKAMPITSLDTSAYLAAQLARATSQSSDNLMGDTAIANYEAQPQGSPATYASLTTNPPNNKPVNWARSKAIGATQPYKVLSGGLTIQSSTTSFGSWSGDGHYPTTSDLHDDFAYDSVNHVLYIDGTVYINGNLVITQAITYSGNGTLVCTGDANISGNVTPSTGSDPDARHLLCIYSGGNVNLNNNNSNVVGAFYTTGQLQANGNGMNLTGSFVAEKGLGGLANNVNFTSLPAIASFVSPGLPNWGSLSSTAGLVMASWRRL